MSTYAKDHSSGFSISTTNTKYQYGQSECSERNTINVHDGVSGFTHYRGQGHRCELSIHYLTSLNKQFTLSFEFKTNTYARTEEWHSIFQIHSAPDKALGEAWRCPVMMMSVYGDRLAMYRRYDHSKVSVPGKWGCADDNPATTIKSVEVFKSVEYDAGGWNTFVMTGTLGLTGEECLTVSINSVSHTSCGPNTYNDGWPPFLKFGIYKPTSWDNYDTIKVAYRNISYN